MTSFFALIRHATLLRRGFCLLSVACAASVACSSTTTGSTECGNVSGGYVITSECLDRPVLCEMTQTECTGSVTCEGMAETTIEISREAVNFSLDLGPCVGAPSSEGLNGACTSAGGMTCDFQAARIRSGQCGLTWTGGDDPQCDACAAGFCCTELQACAPGTACSTLLECITLSCPGADPDPACVTAQCGMELANGGSDAENLRSCVLSECMGCL